MIDRMTPGAFRRLLVERLGRARAQFRAEVGDELALLLAAYDAEHAAPREVAAAGAYCPPLTTR